MKTKYIVLAAAAIISLSVPAYADHGKRGFHEGFAKFDANRDGVVSKKELNNFFAKADANKDGRMSKDEWVMQCHKGMMKHGKGYPQCDHDMHKNGSGANSYNNFNE